MKIDNVLICDVETTGLSPDTDRIIEIGAVLYSVKHRTVLAQHATLIDGGIGNAAEEINRIPAAALVDGYVPARIPAEFSAMARHAQVFAAHRAEFDQSFVAAADSELAASMSWVCTKFDVEWPRSKPGASLVNVALDHGVPVVSAHRALTDCMLLAEVFRRCQQAKCDLEAMLVRALRPKVRVVANLPRSCNDELKAHGFRWNPDRSQWWKTVFADEVAALPFAVTEAP